MKQMIMLFWLCCTALLYSQDFGAMYASLQFSTPSERLEVYIKLAEAYQSTEMDSARKYCNIVLDSYQIEGATKLSSRAHYLLGNCLFNEKNWEAAEEEYQRGYELAKVMEQDRVMGEILGKIGLLYAYRQEYDKAIDNLLQSRTLLVKENYAKGLAFSSNNLGICYTQMGEFHKALEALQFAVDYLSQFEGKSFMVSLYGNMSGIYSYLGDFEKSSEFTYKALEIAEETDDIFGMASQYNNIGNLLMRFNRYAEGCESMKKALELFRQYAEESGEQRGVAQVLNNLSLGYNYLEEYDVALDYALQSLELKKTLPMYYDTLPSTYNNVGLILNNLNRQSEALVYLNKALDAETARKGKWGMANALYNISASYLALKDYDAAYQALTRGVKLAEEIDSMELVRDGYENLKTYYQAIGDFGKALESLKYEYAFTESLEIAESDKVLNTLTTRHETNKSKQEIENLALNAEAQNLSLTQKRREFTRLLLIISIVFVAFLVMLLLFIQKSIYQKKLKIAHTKILNQRELMDHKQRKLKELTEQQQQLNDSKNRFLTIIANDLRHSFNAIRSGSSILLGDIDTLQVKEMRQQAMRLKKSADYLYMLLENILNWSRSKLGQMRIRPTNFDLADVVSTVQEIIRNSSEEMDISIHSHIPSPLMVYADNTMIASVVLNIISSALHITQPGGTITITSVEEPDNSILIIEDTGTGYKKEVIQELFNNSIDTITLNSQLNKALSIGILLSKEFLEYNGGTLTIESEYGSGSKASIIIPRSKKP